MNRLIRIQYLFLFLLTSCHPNIQDKDTQNSAGKEIFNPLDRILGEKVLHEEPVVLRKDNFQQLLSIPADYLKKKSKLYQIRPLSNNLFLLEQKKKYLKSRMFSILIHVDSGKIDRFYPIFDFTIDAIQFKQNKLHLLCSNLQNTAAYWNLPNQVKLMQLDTNFHKTWQYTAQSDTYLLEGATLTNDSSSTTARLHVIEGCHICYSTVQITLDTTGTCTQVQLIMQDSKSPKISQESYNKLFLHPAD